MALALEQWKYWTQTKNSVDMIKVGGKRWEQCSVHDQFRSVCKFISHGTYIHTESSGGARLLTKKTTSFPSFPDSQGLGVVKVLYRWTLNRQLHQNVQLTFRQAIAELCFQPILCWQPTLTACVRHWQGHGNADQHSKVRKCSGMITFKKLAAKSARFMWR